MSFPKSAGHDAQSLAAQHRDFKILLKKWEQIVQKKQKNYKKKSKWSISFLITKFEPRVDCSICKNRIILTIITEAMRRTQPTLFLENAAIQLIITCSQLINQLYQRFPSPENTTMERGIRFSMATGLFTGRVKTCFCLIRQKQLLGKIHLYA